MSISDNKRQSNIELLRILTMCGVIALHYNNPTNGGGFLYAEGINKFLLYFVESLCIGAVDLFMLISGYFMCMNNKRNLKKPFELLVQVVIFSLSLYILKAIAGKEPVSVTGLLRCFIPTNYFVVLYIAVYFISPIINIALNNVSKQKAKRFLIVSILLFSIWPTIVDVMQETTAKEFAGLSTIGMYGSQWGYNVVQFALMYFIGAYIRLFDIKRLKNYQLIVLLIISSALLVLMSYVNDFTGFYTEKSAWEYCNPIVILIAVIWFELFRNINIGNNKIINDLAKASFTVFLLHSIFFRFIFIEKFVQMSFPIMLLHLVLSITLIYLICWVVYKVYSLTVSKLINMIFDKITVLNRDIYKIV